MNIASEYTQLIVPLIVLSILLLGFLLIRASKHVEVSEDIYSEESNETEEHPQIVSSGTVWYKKKYNIDTESFIPWIDTSSLVTVLQVRGDWLSISENGIDGVIYIGHDDFLSMYMQDDYAEVQAKAKELNNNFKRGEDEAPWFTEVSESDASPEAGKVINVNGKDYEVISALKEI